MNESEQYIADAIKIWIWSGFYEQDELPSMMEDILDGDAEQDMLIDFMDVEWKKKQDAEKTWPEKTDCDRLNAVFQELTDAKIVALQNAGYTMSDGHTEVDEALHEKPENFYQGYCFYHGQDLERVVKGQELMLAYGDLKDTEAGKKVIGKIVCDALKSHGFNTVWDGSPQTRISVPGISWKRRLNA
jgi:hypothetical protein